MTAATVKRIATLLGLSAVAFLVGYKVREVDPQFAAWLAQVQGDEGTPEPGTRLRFDATAYCKGTTTASGVTVRAGIAAADPVLLPVGSVVNVATGDERYNGIYAVLDTGPKVQGRHLDLYIWSCNEALAFGRRGVDVTVMRLGWDPQASAPSLIDRLFRGREARRRARAAAAPGPEGASDRPPAADMGPTPPTDGAAAIEPTTPEPAQTGGPASPPAASAPPTTATPPHPGSAPSVHPGTPAPLSPPAP